MPEVAGWCDKDHCSTTVLSEKTSGDLHIRICQCPICQAVQIEKWRRVRSWVTGLKTKDPEKLLKIAEGV